MALCLAITKKGIQCRNKKHINIGIDNNQPILFCTLHTKKNPEIVILEGTNKLVPYIDIENYITVLHKFNQSNYPQIQNNISSDNLPKIPIDDIKPVCTVCCDEFLKRSDLIECSSSGWEFNHLVCQECFRGHVSSLLNDGIASLECMFNKHDHCQGQYSEENIKQVLELQTTPLTDAMAALTINKLSYSKWQEVMAASDIIKFAGICDNYLICPLCNKWGCIFEIPVGANKYPFYIKCAACNNEWCTLCKRGSHAARSCYELAFSETEQSNAEVMEKVIDKMIQDIATRALTHCCGICGCSYVKEEGCNLMTCPKCNGISCFICGIKLYYKKDSKYWHFTGHDKSARDARCPLWNNYAGDGKEKQGNTEFNISSIEKEFIKFISSNATNIIVYNLICRRIVAIYKKDKAFTNILKNIRQITDNYENTK